MVGIFGSRLFFIILFWVLLAGFSIQLSSPLFFFGTPSRALCDLK